MSGSTLILFSGSLIVSFVVITKHMNTEYKVTSITSREGVKCLGTSLAISLIPSTIITVSFTSIRALLNFIVESIFKLF